MVILNRDTCKHRNRIELDCCNKCNLDEDAIHCGEREKEATIISENSLKPELRRVEKEASGYKELVKTQELMHKRLQEYSTSLQQYSTSLQQHNTRLQNDVKSATESNLQAISVCRSFVTGRNKLLAEVTSAKDSRDEALKERDAAVKELEILRRELQVREDHECQIDKSIKSSALEELERQLAAKEASLPQEPTSDKLQLAQHLVDQLNKVREKFDVIQGHIHIPEIATPGWKKYQLDVKKKNTRLKQDLQETRRSILSLRGKVLSEEEEETRNLAVENQVLEKVILEKSIIRLDLLEKHLLN